MAEIFFAQIREDPEVELAVCARWSPRHIVCVGSGGCVALSLLTDGVESVTAVDLNPAQCALIELKRAAIAELERSEYLAFIGEGASTERADTFRRVAPRLPASARTFWETQPETIAAGINHGGTTERFYRHVGRALRSVVADADWQALLECPSVERQRELHQQLFTTDAWRTAIRSLLSKTTHLRFFPTFMFANATEDDFGLFFSSQFDREVLTKSLCANYFLSQFLFSRYLEAPRGMPPYLVPDRWDEIKRNAGKLRVVAEPIQSLLTREHAIDAFFLSNVLDWMNPAERASLSSALLRSAAPGAAVLFRHMLSTSAPPADLANRMTIDLAESAALHHQERSMSYQRITSGVVS